MPQEVDTREAAYQRLAAQNVQPELERVRNFVRNFSTPRGMQAHSPEALKVNSFTGSPAELKIPGYRPSGQSTDALINDAMRVAQEMTATGFAGDAQPPEFIPDSKVDTTSAETKVVHLHQHYRGIPLFQMTQTVRFSRDEMDIVGTSLPLQQRDLPIDPVISAREAVLTAAQHLASTAPRDVGNRDGWGQPMPPIPLDLSSFDPTIVATFSMPSHPTVFEKGPFDYPIRAHLVFFYQGRDASNSQMVRLGWNLDFYLPQASGQFQVIVGADQTTRGEILYAKETSHTMQDSSPRVEGNVFETNGGQGRRTVPFPRDASDLPQTIQPPPVGFPGPWVEANKTIGRSTHAFLVVRPEPDRLDVPGEGQQTPQGVLFNPQNPSGGDQQVLNEFYFCNIMHDFFERLGFTVESGNFEGDDPVEAFAHPRLVRGTANMLTRPDAQSPTMNMGLVQLQSGDRHTALDADVVYHEFAHGVTNRLVGGKDNTLALQEPQSRAQGEGWSDFFALTYQNERSLQSQEKVTTGAWVVSDPNGIRTAPYTDDYPHNYDALPNLAPPHGQGEVWCATLMHMIRRMSTALGENPTRAYQITWQIVVDGLKLSPANPSFLDSRDSIIKALEDLRQAEHITPQEGEACFRAAWEAFAGFGMGRDAFSFGASVFGIQADFHLPDELGGTMVDRPRRSGMTFPSTAQQPLSTTTADGVPAELQMVIDCWNQLSDKAKGRIQGIVESSL